MNTLYISSFYLTSGSYYFDNHYPNGIMVPSGSSGVSGSIQLIEGGFVDLGQLTPGIIYPILPRIVQVFSGNLYLFNGSRMFSYDEILTAEGEVLITEDNFDLIMEQGTLTF